MRKIGDYYVNQHSCFFLPYHLVLITKNRKKILQNQLKIKLLNYTKQYFEERDIAITMLEMNGDYFHIMFEASPHTHLSKLVNSFKSASSRVMKKEFPTDFENSSFWSMSYFIGGANDITEKLVKNYIDNKNIV